MISPTRRNWRVRRYLTNCAALFAIAALAGGPTPAQARGWVSIGVPFPGYYYGPGPYYGYPPYGYAPQPDYYAPPNYPAPAAYPPPTGAAPSAYAPPAYDPPGYNPSGAMRPAGAAAAGKPGITYTNKPAFTNAAGQTCREYKATDSTGGHAVDVFGTACKQADGQWRVVN